MLLFMSTWHLSLSRGLIGPSHCREGDWYLFPLRYFMCRVKCQGDGQHYWQIDKVPRRRSLAQWCDYDIIQWWMGYVETIDGGKNPSQQTGSLPIPQVPIRLTNISYGRPDGIMDPLPSRGWFELVKINQEKEYRLGLSYSNFLESNSNQI